MLNVFGAIVCHIGNFSSFLEILVLQLLDLFVLFQNDAVQKPMLIVVFINLQVFLELSKVTLKLFYLLPIFEFFGLQLHKKGLNALSFSLLVDVGNILIIEFEVRLDKLHEKKIVIADK